MSKRPRPQSSSSDSDERVGRAVEEDLSSSDDNSILDKKPAKKKVPVIRPRVRLPISRRSEIIDKRKRGIDDHEYSCVQNPKTKTWIVRKRNFPLDQTIRHETPIPLTKEPVKEVEAPKEVPKKDDLELSYANSQAGSDKLTKQLDELSAKFDRLSEKYEAKKKAKSKVAKLAKKVAKQVKPATPIKVPKPKEEYSYYSDDEPAPVPQARPLSGRPPTPVPPMPSRLPVGVYRRAGPISIGQF
jgi:outer membrane murein-binding lipoprotein Lpp